MIHAFRDITDIGRVTEFISNIYIYIYIYMCVCVCVCVCVCARACVYAFCVYAC